MNIPPNSITIMNLTYLFSLYYRHTHMCCAKHRLKNRRKLFYVFKNKIVATLFRHNSNMRKNHTHEPHLLR